MKPKDRVLLFSCMNDKTSTLQKRQIGNGIPIEVIRSDRKSSVLIEIRWQLVRVRAPKDYPENEITRLLHKRESWILDKLNRQTKLNRPMPGGKLTEGSQVCYLGKQYSLKLLPEKMRSPSIQIVPHAHDDDEDAGNATTIAIRYPRSYTENKREPLLRKALAKWYNEQGVEYLTERTRIFGEKIQVHPKSIRVRSYRSRWGSCSVRREISYNWRIMLAPPNVVDYIVIHELCHLLEHNHSRRFWAHVARHCPNYPAQRQWLRDFGATLMI